MRVGIDARFLTHPQHGGFKAYTKLVVRALSGFDAENEYILYTDRADGFDIDLPNNFSIRPASGWSFAVREQIALPLRMRLDGIEVCHFPCNTAPMLCANAMALTIHDTIALDPPKSRPTGAKQRMLSAYWRTVTPRCGKRASMVITSSQFVADRLCSMLGLSMEKISVVPIAVDPAFRSHVLPDTPPLGPESRTDYILGFAAADGRKNGAGLFGAYRLVAARLPGLRLILVCATPAVKARVESLGDKGVLALCSVSQGELGWLYRNARVFVFPSFDEGFGLPPLEAMACGAPVVASDRGSLSEVLGDAALFANPESPESIADAIARILGDKPLRDGLVDRGLARAAQFTLDRMAEGLLGAYHSALNRRRGGD